MQKPENSTIINVCIIPNPEVSAVHEALSRGLDNEATLFSLGNDKFAHMTVFMARFGDNQVDILKAATAEALATVSPFELQHVGYFLTEGGYLETSYRKTAELTALHEQLINRLAPLRLNPGQPYEEGYFAPYTAKQRANAGATGYDLAYDLYRPHITLTRYKADKTPNSFPALPGVSLHFPLETIALYKADDNGAVYELVQEFRIA